MSAGKCKDCKFWGSQFSDDCSAANEMLVRGVYKGDEFGLYTSAADDWGLEAYLLTGPEFGCVKFERKNQAVKCPNCGSPLSPLGDELYCEEGCASAFDPNTMKEIFD